MAADTIIIPATGTGTSQPPVAVDDCGAAGNVQVIKIAIATAGSATPVPADATAGILCDPSDDALRDLGKVDIAAFDVALPAGTNNIGDVDVASSALPTGASTEAEQQTQTAHLAAIETAVEIMDDWDESDRAKVNVIVGQAGIAGGTGVDGATVPRVTLATNVGLPAGTAALGSVTTTGNVAAGAADSGNPLKVGYKAISHGTNPTGVDANDRSDSYSNVAGIPWVIGGHPNIITIAAAYAASAQTDTAIITVGAGAKIVVTSAQLTASAANTVAVGFYIGFGTANTPTTTGVVLTHPQVVPGSGISRGDGSGIIGIGADNEDLRITADAATGGSIRVLISYYTIES